MPRCPEIECVRHLLAPGVFALAELRAAEIGVGADRVLIAQGLIDEETYLSELARELGCGIEPLEDQRRENCPLSDDRMIEAIGAGMLPIAGRDGIKIVVAPRELTVRRLLEKRRAGSDLATRIRLTSGARISRFAARHSKRAIAYKAAEALRAERPALSAGTGHRRSIATAVLVTATAALALAAPGIAAHVIEIVLGLVFLAWTASRLLGTLSRRTTRHVPMLVADRQLPTYTIVIALYREAAAVHGLVASLRKLNYPGIMAQTPQD